jgi:ribosome-associated protein
VILRSDEFRDQESNRKRVLEKLDQMIERAFFQPKQRKATKPTRSSQRKRRDEKRNRGEIKAGRGKVHWEE